MRTYKIVLIFISALIIGGIIGFFTTGFATAGSVTKEATFYYEPSSPDPIESLNITCDIGKINIQYNSLAFRHVELLLELHHHLQ